KVLLVDPGTHVCVLRAPGRADARVDVALLQGEERTVELTPGAPEAKPAQPAAPPPKSPLATSSAPDGKNQRTLGIALGGAGLVALVVGTVFGLVAKGTYDSALTHCPNGPSSCDPEGADGGDRAHGQATAATISFVAAGVLLGAGTALYLTAPRAGS